MKAQTKTFLEYVAEDIIAKWGTNLSRTAIVFPNKRAALFLNEALVQTARQPVWSPTYITISDLFRQHSTLEVADPIKLICDLHKSFTHCTRSTETLDHFYAWGQLLLADFDDIDKNMADAEKVFSNLRNLHEYDDTSYLTDEQKELLRQFFNTFNDGHDTELKRRFEELWNHFGDIYTHFNTLLRNQGLTYEGALYREVATDYKQTYEYDRYSFIGFNMLQRVEQKLFERLKKEGKAFFYWDFDAYYMPNGNTANAVRNEAGHYIAQYLSAFPNELDTHDEDIYNNFINPQTVSFINATTENIQARYVAQWLGEKDRLKAGRHTAIVMCDENVLQAVLHNLPAETDKVNVTTGYPLGQTPVASLINQLLDLRILGLRKRADKYNLHYVNKVLRHPYAKYLSEQSSALLQELTENHIYYPSLERLGIDDGLKHLFGPLTRYACASDHTLSADIQYNLLLIRWMADQIQKIGVQGKDDTDALFQESVFRAYTILSRLETLSANGDIDVNIITLRRLITQLIDSTSVPFHGEPAIGLQIMGVLETRNIDFDHLLLLSCSEGNMPKGVNDASFIPYSLRKAYGLTTIDNKVAIYSYYFHRLLQRANDITIAYCDVQVDGKSKEPSRFLLQLLVESPLKIQRLSMQTGDNTIARDVHPIVKDDHVLQQLRSIEYLSPSAINRYIDCPLRFFYQHVAKIKEPDCGDDISDNRMFGLIFHRAAELAYRQALADGGSVSRPYIDKLLQEKGVIERLVDQAFDDELFKTDGKKTSRPEYNGLQIINREVIIEYLRQLLKIDRQLAPFRILGLEMKVNTTLNVCVPGHQAFPLHIGGIIDRLDAVTAAGGKTTIRVIDYKTGKPKDCNINSVEDIFCRKDNAKQLAEYAFQTIFYANIVDQSPVLNADKMPVSPGLLFIKQKVSDQYTPILSIDKSPVTDVKIYQKEFTERLQLVLADLFDPDKPFTPTDNRDQCINEHFECPFRKLCYL